MIENTKFHATTGRYLLLAGLLLLVIASGPSTASSSCTNGNCFVYVSSSPRALICGIVVTILALLWPRPHLLENNNRSVPILRRLGAFVLDFMVVVAALSPFLGVAMLLMEAKATEVFVWSFERDFSRPSDWQIMVPGILLMQLLLVSYFYAHNTLKRQTVGKYIFGYTIINRENKKPNYAAATVLSVIGMCMWPISLFLAARRGGKSFWWDEASNTKAVLIS